MFCPLHVLGALGAPPLFVFFAASVVLLFHFLLGALLRCPFLFLSPRLVSLIHHRSGCGFGYCFSVDAVTAAAVVCFSHSHVSCSYESGAPLLPKRMISSEVLGSVHGTRVGPT